MSARPPYQGQIPHSLACARLIPSTTFPTKIHLTSSNFSPPHTHARGTTHADPSCLSRTITSIPTAANLTFPRSHHSQLVKPYTTAPTFAIYRQPIWLAQSTKGVESSHWS
ncbi:hypothetical protein M758_1G306800 [Ceratodon purpureus]|nr:hypothetical protein M758_1G306800 [Ceratodon purpureus]